MQQLHGSGKTAVLVERIINKIINQNVDIDKILVVTFTNAAASEMRERILDSIYKKIEENPDNVNLQRQIILLNKSNISTIHSFCLDVIKNNFYEIDVSPNFKIGDATQIELLKQEVIEELFEEKYIENEGGFLELINTYTNYKSDDDLKEIILKIYKYIQSSPFPEEWLNEKIEMFNLKEDIDFATTIWGEILLDNFKDELENNIAILRNLSHKLLKEPELEKYRQVIILDTEYLDEIYGILNKKLENKWDIICDKIENLKFDKWPQDRKISSDLKDNAKEIRDNVKNDIKKITKSLFLYKSEYTKKDLLDMYKLQSKLRNLIIEFSKMFAKKKREKNIIDFNDIEHFALKILVKKDEMGTYIPTEVALKYREKFEEIAIDEYQDSNLVQEYILSTISKQNNLFMVGDVKQSIYKFRQARPELFISKYESYKSKDTKKEDEDLKIQLFKNFRSRKNVLNISNLIFKNIMSRELGDINYNEDEYLNLGANYEEIENQSFLPKLYIIDKQEEEVEEDIETDDAKMEQTDETEEKFIENTELEAKFVARKIKKLIDSGYKVFDKKLQIYRKITYKDIVILLRSTSTQAQIYEEEILKYDMPVFSDTQGEYLTSIEIQTIMSFLKIIDNPIEDIALVTVLRSIIGGFTDNELIQIRLSDSSSSFYKAMKTAKISTEKNLRKKIEKFLNLVEEFRQKQEYLSLDELIWQIYIKTGYYNFVSLLPNGNQRIANLKLLFEKAKEYEKTSFKGVFNFIVFIDRLKISSGDMAQAKIISENENVIRIMSIHKSKGLEFPVVFLCGTGRKFNMQDLNENILLHQDIGIGPKVINYQRQIEYNTLAREAIKQKIKLETLSEEMRILYVALTRAKEQIIITGVKSNVEEDLDKKARMLEIYERNDKISKNIIKKFASYLDWIELVYLYNKDIIKDNLDLEIYYKNEVLKQAKAKEKEKTESLKSKLGFLKVENEEIKTKLEWKYKNILASKIEGKTSVTKIKQLENLRENNLEEDTNIFDDEYGKIKIIDSPKFLKEDIKVTAAQKGTITHLILKTLNEKEDYDLRKIKEHIREMVKKDIILEKEAESIDDFKIYKVTKSKLWEDLRKAKKVYKEKPFYINIKANEVYGKEVDENILVQGIIDLYYIDKNNKMILVDYKTDYLNEDEEFREKYKKQLDLYKKAIAKSEKRNVDKVIIYSVYLEREIEV